MAGNGKILGGTVNGDTVIGGAENNLIYGDTITSNSNVPLEFTTAIDDLPFSGVNTSFSINDGAQTGELPVSSSGDAILEIAPELVNGGELNVDVTGVIPTFNYEFYDSVPAGFSARNIPTTGADFTGTAEDLNVRDLALDLTGSHDTYAVRYTTEIHITEAGEYDFATRSDDGSILSINGEEVVVNDGLHATQTRTGSVELEAGTHEIELTFFENFGGDNLRVALAGPDTNGQRIDILESGLVGQKQTVSRTVSTTDISITGLLPGLNYEFFDAAPNEFTVDNIPQSGADFTGVTEELNVGALADDLTGDTDTFSIRYTGAFYVEEGGQYDFSSLSDDGLVLKIGGQTVIDFDGLHAPTSRDGSVILSEGLQDVEILYFENTGQNVLDLSFSGPDTDGEEVEFFDSPNLGRRGEIFTVEGSDDLLFGGAGDDVIIAGAGNDAITGGEGADQIDGGAGTDYVGFQVSSEAVEVNLDTGLGRGGDAEGDTFVNIENVRGSDHDDTITGDSGRNRLVGRDGDDVLNGGAGNDVLLGGRGADVIDGGDGDRDAVEFSGATAGIIINLETGETAGDFAVGDQIINTEFVYGSSFDDEITGDANTNRLVGRDGDDILNGGAGNDVLVGGFGADLLVGGSGDRDAADYSGASVGVGIDLTLGGFSGEADGDTFSGIEFVYGSDFDDTIIGDAGKNRLIGGDGDDTLSGGDGEDYYVGGLGADTIDGGAGVRDTIDFKDAAEGVGVDLANGGFAGEADGDTYANIEYVYGSSHDDIIFGDDAQNRLIGFEGNDEIHGGGGNDYIIGMLGDDTLTGDAGDDVFLYKTNFGDDVITDFEAGAGRTDRLWLDLSGIEEVSDLTITDTAEGALIDTNGFGTILLENVAAVDLNNDDFIF